MGLRLVCLALILLTTGCHQQTGEERAIAEVERLGGKVRKDGQLPGTPVTRVQLTEGRVTDAELQVVKSFPQLRSLDLRRTPVTDKGMVHLERLTKLQELYLDSTRITDAGLGRLEGLKELRKLTLSDTEVSDLGLGFLNGLNDLEELSLTRTKVTEKGVQRLRESLPKVDIRR
ncbi:MAG TPA: hypothetical protein VGF59_37085 [Bryobacteraceae bacterium]